MTDPVIANSTAIVSAATIASASGRWSPRLRLEIEVVGGEAGHSRVAGARAQLAHELPARLAQRRGGGDHGDGGGSVGEPERLPDGGDAGRLRGDTGDPFRLLGAAVDGERDRRVAVGREVGTQRLVDLPGAGGGGQHLRVDGREPDSGEREAERDEQHRRGDGDARGAACHEPREAVPEAVRGDPCVTSGAARKKRGGKRVDAIAEQREDGG